MAVGAGETRPVSNGIQESVRPDDQDPEGRIGADQWERRLTHGRFLRAFSVTGEEDELSGAVTDVLPEQLAQQRREGLRRQGDRPGEISHGATDAVGKRGSHKGAYLRSNRQADMLRVQKIGSERKVRPMLFHGPEWEEQPSSLAHRLGEFIPSQIDDATAS
jgi:hypothetical protein